MRSWFRVSYEKKSILVCIMHITAESSSGEISICILLVKAETFFLGISTWDMRMTMPYGLQSQKWNSWWGQNTTCGLATRGVLAFSLVVKFPFPPRRPYGIARKTSPWALVHSKTHTEQNNLILRNFGYNREVQLQLCSGKSQKDICRIKTMEEQEDRYCIIYFEAWYNLKTNQ